MTSPRIVVGVAVFNEERYLRETVPAILAQTFTDFRLILLDNGSTDASADTLWELVEGDKRVTVLYEPVNRGSTHGGNRVWRYALEQWERLLPLLASHVDLGDPEQHVHERWVLEAQCLLEVSKGGREARVCGVGLSHLFERRHNL